MNIRKLCKRPNNNTQTKTPSKRFDDKNFRDYYEAISLEPNEPLGEAKYNLIEHKRGY